MSNIYKYEGEGHCLGAVVIVQADSLQEALGIINTELISNGLKPTEESKIKEQEDDKIIYSYNGDY